MANEKHTKTIFNRILSFFNNSKNFNAISPDRDIESIVTQYNNIVQSKVQKEFLVMKNYIDPNFGTKNYLKDTLYAKYMKVLRNQFGRYYRYLTYIQMVQFTPELESALDT